MSRVQTLIESSGLLVTLPQCGSLSAADTVPTALNSENASAMALRAVLLMVRALAGCLFPTRLCSGGFRCRFTRLALFPPLREPARVPAELDQLEEAVG